MALIPVGKLHSLSRVIASSSMADETKTNATPETPDGPPPPAPEQTEQAVIPGVDGGPV